MSQEIQTFLDIVRLYSLRYLKVKSNWTDKYKYLCYAFQKETLAFFPQKRVICLSYCFKYFSPLIRLVLLDPPFPKYMISASFAPLRWVEATEMLAVKVD